MFTFENLDGSARNKRRLSASAVCLLVSIFAAKSFAQTQSSTTAAVKAQTPDATPPAMTALPTGVTWLYLNGKRTLAGDFTQSGTSVNYRHSTSDGYNGGTKDILFTSTAPWGLFLPYWSANYSLPNPGWTYFYVAIKPTITGDTFGIYAEKVGDVDPGCHIELVTPTGNAYGPAAKAGVWALYKVPLKDLCIEGDKALYKIAIKTHTASADSWELDALGFQ